LADPVGTASTLDAKQVVAGLQARYDSTHSFKAAFRQEIESRALGQELESWGTVSYRRPGRMRWEFAGPDQQTVIADGTTLWIHQVAQRQVIKIPLESAFRTTTPMSFLVGLGRVRDDFQARLGPATPDGPIVLELLPLAAGGDVGVLQLQLAPGTYDIVGAMVRDGTGGTTRWVFSERKRNIELADDLFEFVVPSGVDVVVPPS
jgi:outer membrane lipoprotein carrier protein